MRKADQIKEDRSYIVVWDSNKQRYKVKGESWLPGYTAAHKATPEEAVQYELDLNELYIRQLEVKRDVLNELKEKN